MAIAATKKKKGAVIRAANGTKAKKTAPATNGAAADKAAEDAMNQTADPESKEITNQEPVAEATEAAAAPSAVTEQATVLPDNQEDDEEEDDDDDDDDNDEEAADSTDETADVAAEGEEAQASDDDDDVIKLPENEFAFLQEIMKNPVGDPNEYMFEISKDAPKAAFKGRGSPKTLAQTAKNKLIQRGIIKQIQKGGAQSRAIVQLLIENVEMSNEGRGRKVNTPSVARTTGSGRKPGRPKNIPSTAREIRSPREEAQAPGRRPGRQSTLKSVLAELRGPDYEDPNEFEAELERVSARFPNTFNKFVKVLRRSSNGNGNTNTAAA